MDEQEIRWEYYPLVAAHPATHAFVAQLSLKGKRAKTIDAYARAIEDLLNYFSGKDPSLVLEADEADLDGYIAHLKRRAPKKEEQWKERGGRSQRGYQDPLPHRPEAFRQYHCPAGCSMPSLLRFSHP